ncbi:hypothetical protein AC249_AIPGENE1755 [Exaiptasia diaphana]|nr:hypothetical protein AC249_AIPGENE1755 [Exaiptasia diaphana]
MPRYHPNIFTLTKQLPLNCLKFNCILGSQPVTTAPDSQNNSTNPPVTTAPDGQNNSTNPPATTVPDSQNNSTNPQVTTAPDSQNNSTNPPVTTALDGQNNSTSPIVNASPPSASWTLRCGILLLMTIMLQSIEELPARSFVNDCNFGTVLLFT